MALLLILDMFFLFYSAVIGFFMRFEDDSVESAKTVKQWNVKIISVSTGFPQDNATNQGFHLYFAADICLVF